MKLSIIGGAQKHQGASGGTYFLQEEKTNNKPFWIHQSGGKAIWWSPNDYWNIGEFSNLGITTTGIYGPSNNDNPPNKINNGWHYYNGTNWPDADDVHFEDWTFKQGKFLHSLCKNLFHVYAHRSNSNECVTSMI